MNIHSFSSDMPIAVFDSGFGGLTVLKQLLKTLPDENYIYLGDNANIPYGSKPKNEIIDLTSKMTDFLLQAFWEIHLMISLRTNKTIKTSWQNWLTRLPNRKN